MKVENSKAKRLFRIGILMIITIVLIPSFFSLTKNIVKSAQSKAASNLAFEKIEFEFENIYSEELKTQISAFIQAQIQQTNLLNFDQNKFYKLLKNNFNIIKQFECHITSLVLHFKIVGITPFCIINNKLVLGNKKKLFPVSFFDQATLTDLKNISIDEQFLKCSISKDLYLAIKQIPEECWNNFHINFVKFTKTYLTPKNPALNYCLLTKLKTTEHATTLDMQKINKAQELYKKLMKPKKNHILLLDLRFKNRIVTSFISLKLKNKDGEGGL